MALVALVMAALTPPASAQYWATVEFCTVETPELHPESFAPDRLADLERAAQAELPNAKGNFWRVEAPGGAVSHLWGTFHSSARVILDIPDAVEDAVRSARLAAFEFDPVPQTRRAYEMLRDPPGFFRDPRAPRTPDLPEDILDNIRTRLAGLGWGRDTVEFLTLGGLAEILLADPCDDFAYGTYPTQDSLLQTFAMMEGARILGLEAPDSLRIHLNRPGNEALALDLLMLYGAYLSPDATNRERSTSFALYLTGRNGAAIMWERAWLRTQFGAARGEAMQATVNGYLVDERNRRFLAAALPELRRGGVFIGIGAWHLPGQGGMVELLREAGFDVTRIPLDREAP